MKNFATKSAHSPAVLAFHERSVTWARTAVFEPLVTFLNGETGVRLATLQVLISFISIALGIALALTLLGLENAEHLNFFELWLVWILQVVAAFIPLAWVTRRLRGRGWPALPSATVAAIVALPVLTAASLVIDSSFQITERDTMQAIGFSGRFLDEAFGVFPILTVVWAVAASFFLIKLRPEVAASSEAAEDQLAAASAWPACLAEVKQEQRGELIALSSDQHYLWVLTSCGKSFIRGSMRDVVAQLDAIPGLQIHRSHWVVRDQIERLELKGGRLYCVMTDDHVFPVSRRRKVAVKAALMKLSPSAAPKTIV